MMPGSGRRHVAMRSNYASPTNLEKRQSLNSFAVSVEGTTTHEIVSSLDAGSFIVDVGCGNGLWMDVAAPRGTVVGVDLSMPMLVGARSRFGRPVACGDASRLPLRDHSVDAALMLWMLYHVPDKASALQEIKRILRSGGRLVTATNASSEDGPHADLIRQALGHVLDRDVADWIEPLDFNAENGESILSEHFGSVTNDRWTVTFELHEPAPLVAYLDSGKDPIEAEVGRNLPWPAILATLQDLAADHIRRNGSLRFQRSGASFVAR